MILFLYGEDNYRLRQKVKEMKEKYISASLGDTNLCVLDGKTTKGDDIIRQALAFPFLAKSRLVIVENLLMEGKKEEQEKIGEFLKKNPETTVLVFLENGVPDKRTSLFKKLSKEKTQEFKPLSDSEVKSWIKEEVLHDNGKIESDAMDKLFEYVGADLWRLSNEIRKLTTYKGVSFQTGRRQDLESSSGSPMSSATRLEDDSISVDDIELLVKPQVQSDIFALIDAVASRNVKKALKELHQLLENGQNELYLLTMIVYQYRNMLIAKDLVDRGVSSQYDIAKQAGLHPFVAGKTLNLVRNYSISELKNIYAELLEYDLKLKTGQIDPKTALDLLVLNLAG
jgi:DNA polymerase-3 subunit delta